jgi:hypothetical protein
MHDIKTNSTEIIRRYVETQRAHFAKALNGPNADKAQSMFSAVEAQIEAMSDADWVSLRLGTSGVADVERVWKLAVQRAQEVAA